MRRLIGFIAAGLAALTAVVVGCRNLDLPSANSGSNPGPTLRFVSPVSIDDAGTPEVSLVSFISVEAQDADGVGEVDLSCQTNGSEVGLIRWVSTPYEGSVDLSPCHSATADGGDPEVTLLLTASATDALGNHSTENQSVRVRVNIDVAALAIQVPPRVSPGQAFDITVTSDRPLIGVPNVKVEGAAAQFTGSVIPDGGHPSFTFHTPAAPLLGASSFTGPGDPPIETLEENERLIAVTAEGRAENGNLTQVVAQVSVARVLWTRALPNAMAVDSVDVDNPFAPMAVAGAVYVPIAALRAGLQPVFFRAQDGEPLLFPDDFQAAYRPIQPLASGEMAMISKRTFSVGTNPDGGIAVSQFATQQSVGLDDAGLPFWPDGGVLKIDGGTGVTVADLDVVVLPGFAALVRPSLAIQPNANPVWQMGNFACSDVMTLSTCASAGPPPNVSVNCVGATSDILAKGGTDGLTGSPLMTRSGNTLAMVNAATSCGGLNFPIKLAALTGSPTSVVTWPGQQFERVLSEDNGRFFGIYFNTGLSQDLLFEFDLTSGNRFSSVPLPTVEAGQVFSDQVLAARPDGTAVFFAPGGLTTTFGAWRPVDGTQVTARSTLPIVYQTVYGTPPVLTPFAQVDADGSVYLLLWRAATGQGAARTDIVALDPSMKVKWIYHYDRADLGRDNALRISLDRASGQLYLVDGDNGFVVALAR